MKNDDHGFRLTRREVLKAGAVSVAASVVPVSGALAVDPDDAAAARAPVASKVAFTVNGQPRQLEVDTRTTLLDALREHLHLTGTKKGCDQGQCGACTVIVDGRRINSCLTLAVMHNGAEVTTIEGLGTPDKLHPMQAAFVKHDGYQCGYCTPGQVCASVAALEEIKAGVPSHATADLTAPPAASSPQEGTVIGVFSLFRLPLGAFRPHDLMYVYEQDGFTFDGGPTVTAYSRARA